MCPVRNRNRRENCGSFGAKTNALLLGSHLDLAVDLKTFDAQEFLNNEDIEGLQHAKDEIIEVFKMVRESHNLHPFQVWIGLPYMHSNPAHHNGNMEKSCNSFDLSRTEEVLALKFIDCYSESKDEFDFCKSCDLHPLRKGQGLVGKALLTNKPYFCNDISQLSITEYPLSHHARDAKLSSSFVICLRSAHTGSFDYVLEFFLPNCNKDIRDAVTLLDPILTTMKQHFQSFKVASGEELGEELSVQLIQHLMNDELDSFKICKTTRSPSRPEVLEREGEVVQLDSKDPQFFTDDTIQNGRIVLESEGKEVQLDSSCQQFTVEDPTQNERTVVGAEQSGTTISPSSVKEHRTEKIKLSFEDIKQHFGRKQEEAANSLNVSRSSLKRMIRLYGLERWPTPKRNKVSSTHSNLKHANRVKELISELNGDDLSRSDLNIGRPIQDVGVLHTTPDVTPMQNMSTVRSMVIIATYGDDKIKFRLQSSSGVADLRKDATERLPLKDGHFSIMYEDHKGQWILIACDKDLQECMRTSRSLDEIKMCIANQAPMQDVSTFNVKASYGNDLIKFQLSFSSTMANLEEKVTERLKLNLETFRLKYLDEENEWVSITCDKVLWDCMASLRSLDKTTIRMSVQANYKSRTSHLTLCINFCDLWWKEIKRF